ncbi:MAG: hypothetical protein O3A53_09045 [Acidobacteria bacterium]|nr:hypothetical protein [Acidobacteriota bacterium]MDA1234934.1 hypothetical protein [Acidobacteriota bacterium]
MRLRLTTVLCALLLAPLASAQAQQLVVLSAPSYASTVSPDSVATAFGVDLANETAVGTLDATGRLPRELAGVIVRVNGHSAQLAYVSTWQLNFVVPRPVAAGLAEVEVILDGATVASGTVEVANVAPGLFSLDSSGTGPGAILNAATYAGSPFVTQTWQLPGCDKRTRLTVYASGLRFADTETIDATLGGISAPIDFAGASELFPGVDELRIIVPEQIASLDNAALTITVDGIAANTVTAALAPAEVPTLACDAYGQAFVYNSVLDLLGGDLWDTTTTASVFADLESVSPSWELGGVGTTALDARNGEVIVNGTAGAPELVWSDPLFPPTVRSLSDEPIPYVGVGAGNPASVVVADAVPGIPIHQQILQLAQDNGLAFASVRISGVFRDVGYSVAHNLLKQGTPLTDPTVDKAPFQLFFTDEGSAEWELSGFYAAAGSIQELVSVFGAPVHLHGFRQDRSRAGHVCSALAETAEIRLYPLAVPLVRDANLTVGNLTFEGDSMSFEVLNSGNGAVSRATVQIISAGSVVHQFELSGLSNGEPQILSSAIPPRDASLKFQIVVDPFNDISESNEADNTLVFCEE